MFKCAPVYSRAFQKDRERKSVVRSRAFGGGCSWPYDEVSEAKGQRAKPDDGFIETVSFKPGRPRMGREPQYAKINWAPLPGGRRCRRWRRGDVDNVDGRLEARVA